MLWMNEIYLPLTGGLGNQLFQLANALGSKSASKILVDSQIGMPRINSSGLPEVCSFDLPSKVETLPPRKLTWLTRKTCGFLLRSNISPKWYEKNLLFRKFVLAAGALLTSLHFGKPLIVQVGQGVGFSSLHDSNRRRLMIGYFQTYRTMLNSEVAKSMKNIKPKVGAYELEKFRELAEREKPLVVHVRLTDYETEDLFGIPSVEYYQEAIEYLKKKVDIGRVWIFSDDIVKAHDFLPESVKSDARLISHVANSSACTLEVMRYGRNYIIANSTFSWWGAALSYSVNPMVIAPQPWFRFMEEPKYLIPENWSRVPAWKT